MYKDALLELIEKFQFLYGTIKRNPPLPVALPSIHFNSSMVQLKAYLSLVALNVRGNFNSSMVQLKDYDPQQHRICFPNFNSSMVQLKASFPPTSPVQAHSFQFLYGTIKSRYLHTIIRMLIISIPLWYN